MHSRLSFVSRRFGVLACLLVGLASVHARGQEPAATKPGDAKEADAKAEVKKELEALKGRWQAEDVVNDGMQQDLMLKIEIDGEKLTAHVGDSAIELKMKVDPGCNPKVIDVTFVGENDQADKGQILEGIYELKDGKLRMCLSTPQGIRQRPQKFESPAGAELVLITFARSGQ